ncbi:MAG: metallophosphoesterase [Desulfurococcaceae archaeon]|nr:metallophosphoesterase [Desulfurococcaceae archaeon]
MFVHTADLHIGAFSSFPLSGAPVKAFLDIAEYVRESGIKYLVISGDLFERPKLENYSLLRTVVKELRRLRDSGVHVIGVSGSHDISVKESDFVHVLRDAGLIHLTKYEEVSGGLLLEPLELGDYVFYGVPGFKRGMEARLLADGRVRFKNIDEVGKPVIVLAHTSVKFYGYDPSDFESRYGKIFITGDEWLRNLPDKVVYVALGHIHYPLPLSHEFRLRAAYAGAPVGRDKNDLRETHELKRKGFKRRFLVVEPGDGLPRVRSVWSDFGVEVVSERISFTNLSEVLNYVKRLAKDTQGDFKVLLINLTNVDPEKLGKILYETDVLKNDLRSKNVTLILNTELKTRGGAVEVEVRPGEDVIETIERSVAENLAKKLGPSATPDKVLDLINILSRKKPEGSSEDEFYEEMFKELMKVLEEVFGESGEAS